MDTPGRCNFRVLGGGSDLAGQAHETLGLTGLSWRNPGKTWENKGKSLFNGKLGPFLICILGSKLTFQDK
jgi:hypothetical protein